MLRTRTFREGGVMIRWFGPLGRVWELAIMPLDYFVLSVVVFWVCILLYLHFEVKMRTLLNV